MDDKLLSDDVYKVLGYVEQLLNSPVTPQIPDEYAHDDRFLRFHETALGVRDSVESFAKGEMSQPIVVRGFLAGSLKALQANLRHLVWKVQQVEKGDYSQRVSFMGDFSDAFNSMVVQLATTIDILKEKEESLLNLAISLQEEARKRSIAIQELKKSEANYKYLAQHDPLTGALNRRSFFSLAIAKLKHSLSGGRSSCICMLDIDYFKAINDNYGHTEGDKALKSIVDNSLPCLRQSDIMGRFGGEEFIFLFADVDKEQGVKAAERIRTTIENNPFTLSDGTIIPLRVSLGVVDLCEESTSANCSIEQLLRNGVKAADKALYQAKAKGRNCVCFTSLDELDGLNELG
ncbi:sensor domain-containing diguanylate cyclase [Desulfovibrio litoralis]|uniref:diguanylate cyclase n=1 Tax=Desulfovibrio litoralis DSM 11393 TaxID=1121455 RepID=A0A1M7T336_9BACT|nr:GGDEF domain-containing protein [Desulfovibrio litoralis]SHN65108.1 diguanylate cyclase (GGDEF) domain-containing protein [Desulfovibrio litoralis DSM 11393]